MCGTGNKNMQQSAPLSIVFPGAQVELSIKKTKRFQKYNPTNSIHAELHKTFEHIELNQELVFIR